MSWIATLIGLGAGVLVGYLLARRFDDAGRRARSLEQELERAREEHAAYRREVGDHFARTASAVNQLTDSYRNVHRELREGAHALCDNGIAEAALAFDSSRLIATAPEDDPATDTSEDAATEASAPEAPESHRAETPPDAESAASDSTADAVDAPEPGPADAGKPPSTGEAAAPEAKAADTEAADTGADDETPWNPSPGGASWTPAEAVEADDSPRQPRDYAEEGAADGSRATRH
ncbi:MAG: DUF1043 family protein [Gammaproteobacteria bacterium]|nr:DUF1043 family protein [Gammaproteobacteria bacterium]